MNCIYCHQDCPFDDNVKNISVCDRCNIKYYHPYSSGRVQDKVWVVSFEHDQFFIDLDIRQNKTYYGRGGLTILTIDHLYWIFPPTVEQWMNRFKGLVTFS